ncbi:unnamed protein product [Ostreobium quekettii]|uniref:SUI1 domain-containing protein n=1 Tax=Ostreobium quekettii TaxID=121088 RepID=A0A8S1J3P8_9CHLO|nr:unnamed protein product [Ostreobium quekettii]
MFKKRFTTSTSHKLSGADRKKLRRSLQKRFPDLSDDDLEAFMPAKASEAEVAKMSSPSRGLVYLLDGAPVAFDPSGRGDAVPTLFALWKLPGLCPAVTLKHWQVSKFVLDGADLMLPGVEVPAGGFSRQFAEGGLVAVVAPGNPAVLAIGVAAMNSREAASRAGGKGRLVEILHSFGDLLWASHPEQPVPNPGFTLGMILPVEEVPSTEIGPDAAEELNMDGMTQDSAAAAASEPMSLTGTGQEGEAECRPETGLEEAEGPAKVPEDAVVDEDLPGTSTSAEEMDELLERCLLQVLQGHLGDGDLPIAVGDLWLHYMVPNRPPGSQLEVKKSSHKKMLKFLQAYGKNGSRAKGLLILKEDKASKEQMLVQVNRSHALYAQYTPYRVAKVESAPQDDQAGPSKGGCEASDLTVEELFKPSRELQPIFKAVERPIDGLYDAKEAGDVAFDYVKLADLDKGVPDNKYIVLDPHLCDALFKGLIKKGERFPTHLAKAELRGAFMHRMLPQYRVTRQGTQVVKKGAVPKIKISEAKRMGNKRVTRVAGIETFLITPEDVAAECQKKFACSTSIDDLPGKGPRGKEVTVQGHVVDELAAYLLKEKGVPKRYVEIKRL